jgi:hypothetical protein
LAECTRLPVFRLGAVLCARRSVLLGWIAAQENRALLTDGTSMNLAGTAAHREFNPSECNNR